LVDKISLKIRHIRKKVDRLDLSTITDLASKYQISYQFQPPEGHTGVEVCMSVRLSTSQVYYSTVNSNRKQILSQYQTDGQICWRCRNWLYLRCCKFFD